MNNSTRLLVLIVLVAAAGFGGYWFGQHHDPEKHGEDGDEARTQPAEEIKPVVEVTVAPLRRAGISQTITAYGSVVAQPGDVRVLSVPFESRVKKVSVIAGQQVAAGAPVIEVEASPAELAALAEAKSSLAAAERDLKQTEQRFADHLATNAELSQAQQIFQLAKLKLDSLTQRGVGTGQTLKSDAAGIVSKIDVQEGGIVPPGGPLVEIVSGNRIEVSLGVEPSDVASLKPGQPVKLHPVDGSGAQPAFDGKIRLISQRVDPASRLASVLVALPPDTHWMLDTYVAGDIIKSTADALVVPRDAVLPEEGGEHILYTVKDGHAVKHTVRVGLENDRDTQVIANDLKEGDPVVIHGNYQLEDGSEVHGEKVPATTETAK